MRPVLLYWRAHSKRMQTSIIFMLQIEIDWVCRIAGPGHSCICWTQASRPWSTMHLDPAARVVLRVPRYSQLVRHLACMDARPLVPLGTHFCVHDWRLGSQAYFLSCCLLSYTEVLGSRLLAHRSGSRPAISTKVAQPHASQPLHWLLPAAACTRHWSA